jgi:hypothetical protein
MIPNLFQYARILNSAGLQIIDIVYENEWKGPNLALYSYSNVFLAEVHGNVNCEYFDVYGLASGTKLNSV